MASNKRNPMKSNAYIDRMAKRLGISPQKVLQAVDNLLYGNGAVYRRVISIPLHGARA